MANYNAPVVENQPLTMNYTGVVDTIKILKDGLYKMEGWGGQGCGGQKAGYTICYKFLKKGNTLYLAVGGKGGYCTSGGSLYRSSYGFNGGGNIVTPRAYTTQGGGATHFALVNGLLQNIGYANRGNILLVAGGSGAGWAGGSIYGGYGGGTSGGNGNYGTSSHGGSSGSGHPGYGGGQTAGGQGSGENGDHGAPYDGVFGKGGDTANADSVCTGGGGFFGGGSGGDGYYDDGGGSGGGSGYVGVPASQVYKGVTYQSVTQANQWGVFPVSYNDWYYSGEPKTYNGKAAITMVKKGTPLMFWSDTEVDEFYYGDKDVDSLFYGDKEVG